MLHNLTTQVLLPHKKVIHSCHLTSRDAFSWSSWSVCFGDIWFRNWDWCTVVEWFVSWFCPTEFPGFFLICLRVSWMISEVRFSTIVKPSCTSELAQVLRRSQHILLGREKVREREICIWSLTGNNITNNLWQYNPIPIYIGPRPKPTRQMHK